MINVFAALGFYALALVAAAYIGRNIHYHSKKDLH